MESELSLMSPSYSFSGILLSLSLKWDVEHNIPKIEHEIMSISVGAFWLLLLFYITCDMDSLINFN